MTMEEKGENDQHSERCPLVLAPKDLSLFPVKMSSIEGAGIYALNFINSYSQASYFPSENYGQGQYRFSS